MQDVSRRGESIPDRDDRVPGEEHIGVRQCAEGTVSKPWVHRDNEGGVLHQVTRTGLVLQVPPLTSDRAGFPDTAR